MSIIRGKPELGRTLKLVSIEEAFKLTINSFDLNIGIEYVSVEEALNRILAEDIVSDRDYPMYDQVFYDGYAFRSVDTLIADKKAVKLKVIGRMDTNDKPDKISLGPGEAVFCVCGAPIPVNADASIRIEGCEVDGDYIIIRRRVSKGENLILKGSDIKKGDILFRRGHIVRPQDIGLLMELNIKRVKVYRRVKIGLIPVGTDLLERLKNGIYYPDNYTQILRFYLNIFGFDIQHYGILPDDKDIIKKTILEALAESDAVAVVGGVSVSKNDVVPDVLSDIGKIIFHGIKVSPGKVTGFAIVNDKPVYMIPGHIGSNMAALFLHLIPTLMYKLVKVKNPYFKVKARLVNEPEYRPGLKVFRTVSVTYVNGEYEAKIINKPMGGSPFLTLLTEANGFVVLDPNHKLSVGSYVDVNIFSSFEALNIYR